MKTSIIFFLLSQAVGIATATGLCKNDNCFKAVASDKSGKPALESRKADCSSYLKVIIVPKTKTVTTIATLTALTVTETKIDATVTETTFTTTILPPGPAKRDIKADEELFAFPTAGIAARDDSGIFRRDSIVVATSVPGYASACNKLAYASACLCIGVKPTITRAATPTFTRTITSTITASETLHLTVTATTTVVETACPTPQSLCSSSCANLRTDEANCGACGNTCASGAGCVDGACTIDFCSAISTCSTVSRACASGGCICVTTDVGNRCAQNRGCAGIQECTVSSDCPEGFACARQGCCGFGSCLQIDTCSNELLPRRLFRLKRGDEKDMAFA